MARRIPGKGFGSTGIASEPDALWHAARIGGPSPQAMPAPAAGEVLINTASDAIAFNARITAFSDGRYVVSWTEGSEATGNFFSTFFRIYAANGTPTSAPIEYGNTSSSDNDYGSFAVLANGNIAAVWAQATQAIVTRVYNATGAVVAAEQVVSTPSTSFPDPSIVALATGYVVAYSSGRDIVYSMRGNTGTVVGTNRYVTDVATATFEDHVDLAALPGGGFVAVWVQETYPGSPGGVPDSSQVMMRLFSSTGAAVGAATAVNAGTAGFSHPSVATLTGGGFVVAWQNEGAAGGSDIVARRYDASGAPVAAEFTVNAAAGLQVQASVIGLANGGFLIAWLGSDGDGNGIFGQAYTSAGVADGGAFRVNETVAGDQTFDGIGADAVVQLADGTLVFTWSGNGEGDDHGIFTRRFSPDDLGSIAPDASDDLVSALPGQPVTIDVLGNDFERSNAATVTAVGAASAGSVVINQNGTLTYTPGAGFNGSDSFTYTITGPGGTDTATVTILDGRTPQPLGGDILANQSVSSVQDDASITALAGGGFVASWSVAQSSSFHAMARVFAADGTPLGAEFQVSSGASIAVSAVAALANGGFAVLYTETASNPDTLYARAYTAAGTPVGAAVAVATSTSFDGIHLTGRAEGGFAIIWSTGTDLFGRFHDNNGAALGAAFTVSASPRTDRLPMIDQLEDGGYIAVWQRITVNGDTDVGAVRLDAAGAVVGAEFRPHASGTGAQSVPVVAALGDGGFVILWSGEGEVFGRRYDSAGVGGAEFRVNMTPVGDQMWPAVIALDDGGFIASWTSTGQDGSGNGIFAQAFDAAGLRYGAEFQVNAVSGGTQTLAVATIDSIAQLADGTLVFSWEGAGAGDSGGVFVRRFSLDLPAIPISGTAGPDELEGTAGDDIIYGLGGDDILIGGAGADSLYGGPGNDIYLVDNSADQVIEVAGEGSDTIYTSVTYQLAAGQSVELLAAQDNSQTSALNLIGNELANVIFGNSGANFLDGGAGTDIMTGFGGDDIYAIDNAGDVVDEGQNGGNDAIYTTFSYVLGLGMSIEILAARDNSLTVAMNLFGNELNNIIFGNSGANFIDGGTGADIMTGFGGDDVYAIDNAGDVVDEGQNGGADTIYTNFSYVLGFGASVEILAARDNSSTATMNLFGNELDNFIFGNNGANFLDGQVGADTMTGFGGDDIYAIDNANDRVVEDPGGGNDAIYTTLSYTLAAGHSIETLAARDNSLTVALNLTGNNLANTITGNNGANILDGGGGADVLLGFGGADMFAFTTTAAAGNADTILDFLSGTDKIGLDDAVFQGIGTPSAFNAAAFVAGSAAADGDDRIIYNAANGQLLYDADGNGAGAAVLLATLQGSPVLSASDFLVI